MAQGSWISLPELTACAAALVVTGCIKLLAWALIAGEYCSGTGTGATRFFRVCNGNLVLLSFVIVDLLPLAIPVLSFNRRWIPLRYRAIAVGIYILYTIVTILGLYILWDSAIFHISTQ